MSSMPIAILFILLVHFGLINQLIANDFQNEKNNKCQAEIANWSFRLEICVYDFGILSEEVFA